MTEKTVPFALYNAFSETLFGGAQGAVVLSAGDIDSQIRQNIASELGYPATCFVRSITPDTVTVNFHSTLREYTMCGHGTICLMTYLLEKGELRFFGTDKLQINLKLPTKTAMVELFDRGNGEFLVMLDFALPTFRNDHPDTIAIANFLGLEVANLDSTNPIEVASGDFVHLIVPIKTLNAMQSIRPNFPDIKSFCLANSIDTIACFSAQTQQENFDFHVRDFCPAVGVAESAAAGTTNAALAAYWYRHDLLAAREVEFQCLKIEQGMEIGRQSTIYTEIRSQMNEISRLQVGGFAQKIITGQLMLPSL